MSTEELSDESALRTRRLRRRLGAVGALIVLALVAMQAAPYLRQARQESRRRAARALLGKLHAAQVRHREAHGAFARLDTLRAAGESPVGEGQAHEGYRYSSTAGRDDYTIEARPEWPGGQPLRIDSSGGINRPRPKVEPAQTPEARIAAAREAARRKPGDVHPWLELARVLFQERRLGEALAAARKAARIDAGAAGGTLRGVLVERGDELLQAGRPREALPLLQEALPMDASNPEVLALVGDAYRGLKRTGEAEKAYRKALALRGATLRAWYGLAKIEDARGNKEEASHAYLRVLSISEETLPPPGMAEDAVASLRRLQGSQ